jgi:hypothetical protein
LCDAFEVPKPLSPQLLPFGKSDDDLGELTFEVERFFVLSTKGGRSPWCRRTVRAGAVHRVFFVFLLAFRFDQSWILVLVGRSFGRSACTGRTVRGCLADSPRAPRGRSVFRGSLLEVLFALTDGPRLRPDSPRQGCRRSAVRCRTVRAANRGRSALPGRTVRQRLSALLLSSIPPFLSRASACASRNRY